MNARTCACTFTLPVRTYVATSPGHTWVSNSRQNGHWRSMYSTIVTGALGEPSTRPFCGMPLNLACTSAAPGRPLTTEPEVGNVEAWVFPLPPDATTATTTPITTSAAPAPAIASVRRDNWRCARVPPAPRTGGGGT